METTLLLSDLHLTPPGERILGLDPWARLEEILDTALARHPDATRVIFMGDLTHRAEAGVYAALTRRLEDLPVEMALMLGNHDRRTPFATAFPGHLDDSGFAQRIIDLPDTRLVLTDTLDEDPPVRHSGILCEHRMAWLKHALAGADGRRLVLLTHHPVAPVGFDGMDAIRLRNGSEVIEVARRASVELVISGHVHRAIVGVARGLPFAVMPSTCHQMPLVLGAGSSGLSVDEAASYGVLLSRPEGITLHWGTVGGNLSQEDAESS